MPRRRTSSSGLVLAALLLAVSAAAAEPPDAAPDASAGGIATPAALPPSRLRMEVHVGQRLMAEGMPERAAERFQSVVTAAPDHAGAWYLLSTALLASGKVAEGRDAAVKSVELLEALPADKQRAYSVPAFYANLGAAQASAAQLEPAEAAYRKAIAAAPKSSELALQLGVLLLRRGKDREAADSLRQAIALGDRSALAQRSLGTALMRLEDLAGAKAAHDEAIRLAPDDADAHYGLASVLRAQGDTAAQEAELATYEKLRAADEARKAAASELDALARDAMSRMADGKCAEAEPLFQKALALPAVQSDPRRRALLLSRLARCRATEGAADEAEERYRESLAVQPGNATASFELGSLLAKQRRLEEAVPLLVDAVAASPFDYAAHLDLGLAWSLLGRLNDAQAEIEKATLLNPDDLEIRQLLVDFHWAVGHRDRAIALAEVGGVKAPGAAEPKTPAAEPPAFRE